MTKFLIIGGRVLTKLDNEIFWIWTLKLTFEMVLLFLECKYSFH